MSAHCGSNRQHTHLLRRAHSVPQDALEREIFGERGLTGTLEGSDPQECAVLMAGLPGEVAAAMSRRLAIDGVSRERILFCDF